MSTTIQIINQYSTLEHDKAVQNLLNDYLGTSDHSMSIVNRIHYYSQHCLGTSYLNGALGEGPNGEFDQSPLYRLDAFDCVTYVNTVLALALSKSLEQFKKNMVRIAYRDQTVKYQMRNHFMSVDWNVNNARQGTIADITMSIVPQKGKSIFKEAHAIIDRPNWFLHRTLQDIKQLNPLDDDNSQALLTKLHACANQVVTEQVVMPYLPFTQLFSENEKPNEFLFKQIPDGAIIEIIRPNWNLRDVIGTHLNVSHMGFAIWLKDKLYFRHASQKNQIVEDELLTSYLARQMNSDTIKGINVLATA